MFANPYRWWNVLIFIAMIGAHIVVVEFISTSDALSLIAIPTESWLTPEHYVLYIWGLIYALLLGFIFYQLRKSTRSKDSIRRIGLSFVTMGLCWIGWVFLWQYEYTGWSFVANVLMLLATFFIYTRSRQSYEQKTVGERLFVYWPFSVLFSWLVFALFMQLSVLLEQVEWNRWGQSVEVWTVVFLLIAGLLAIVIGFKYRDAMYMLVYTWSAIGIAAYWSEQSQLIWMTAGVSGLVILLLMFMMVIRSRSSRQPRLRFK